MVSNLFFVNIILRISTARVVGGFITRLDNFKRILFYECLDALLKLKLRPTAIRHC